MLLFLLMHAINLLCEHALQAYTDSSVFISLLDTCYFITIKPFFAQVDKMAR